MCYVFSQKFGTAEGKSSKELLLSAKKAKKRYIDYTPPGAESVAQVKLFVLTIFNEGAFLTFK